MTTNHPAHGPVSLDRLHQIHGILSKASAQSDGGNLGYAMADAVKVIDGAIAEFDAEPVAYIFKHPAGRLFWALTDGSNKGKSDVMPVYAAPRPAPVVPECTNEQCLEFLSIAFRHAEIKGDLELDDIRLGMKMVNEGRAAMLQAGNSPVTPDGWIPVSERIPEESGRYWCYVEEQNSLGKSHYQWNCSWNGEVWSDKALTGRVTHWMPLPAEPKQEVKL
ncbi:DUF551 domain-containing protein [Salmonella enterica subsp. enterica serovar Waycross]|nr:DUF551 domain-containing protein [Salmonella enterica subsp. enterica serovar Waycross]EBZ8201368.1 DUF551 domain-containing protein [Salmonella enterica subsp. enterica serovar Waycross]